MSQHKQNWDIIAGLHLGEEEAIHYLYTIHYCSLCYFGERMIHNRQEAEDIAVASFIKLLNKKADFNNLPDIKSFLFTTVRNACIDYLRKLKQHETDHKQPGQGLAGEQNGGIEEMIIAKVLQSVYTEVQNLPAECRKIFKAVFMEDKTAAQISKEMKISLQSVLNHKSKALRLMRLALDKQDRFLLALLYWLV